MSGNLPDCQFLKILSHLYWGRGEGPNHFPLGLGLLNRPPLPESPKAAVRPTPPPTLSICIFPQDAPNSHLSLLQLLPPEIPPNSHLLGKLQLRTIPLQPPISKTFSIRSPPRNFHNDCFGGTPIPAVSPGRTSVSIPTPRTPNCCSGKPSHENPPQPSCLRKPMWSWPSTVKGSAS